MENRLDFLKTQSIPEFKTSNGIEGKLDIGFTEKGKYCFMSNGKVLGAVTAKYPDTKLTNPVISRVVGADGVEFNLLHNNSSTIEVVESF